MTYIEVCTFSLLFVINGKTKRGLSFKVFEIYILKNVARFFSFFKLLLRCYLSEVKKYGIGKDSSQVSSRK